MLQNISAAKRLGYIENLAYSRILTDNPDAWHANIGLKKLNR